MDLIVVEQCYIDLVFVIGDLLQDGSSEFYNCFYQYMEVFVCFVYWLFGNYDFIDIMVNYQVVKCMSLCVILFNGWYIIMLDFIICGKVFGNFVDFELVFLKQVLEQFVGNNVLIVLYYQLVLVGSEWLD